MIPVVDPFVAALAAGIAVLTWYGCLSCAMWLSSTRPRCTVPVIAGNTFALGLGLCTACMLEALAFSRWNWPYIGHTEWLVPLALACSGQLCGLVFLIVRQPDLPTILASALSFTAAIAETQWSIIRSAGGLPSSAAVVGAWVAASLPVAFIGLSAGLRMEIGTRGVVSPFRNAAPAALSIVLAGATIASGAVLPSAPRLASARCCGEPLISTRLLALTIASIATAVLVIRQLIALSQCKLDACTRRNRQDLEEAHARLHHIATHDALTGLPNRNLLKERLRKSLADRQPGRTIAVAAIDLDRFSSVNHSLGHAVGDGVLIEIAHRLESVVPNLHTLARVGGDSFGLLIDSVSARLDAHAITNFMMEVLEQPFIVHGEEIRIRLSIGVSVCPDDARRSDDLLAHAETALVASKRSGGGRVLFFDPKMSDSMQERLALENDLRRALAASEFEIHYQPQISTRTGKILSVEALLRWRHPTKGLIAPSSFIPLAEQTGLIVPLDTWVLREATRQARSWISDTGVDLRVAINLSAMQFRSTEILDTIVSAFKAAALEPRFLEIELTESTLMIDPDKSAAALKLLRSMGVSIAIDDFGTGYSSLSYLRRLPIDKLKIDRSFVRDLPSSAMDESIVRAIVSLAHSVGLQVVAEGVETVEQLECVRALDCDQWQGYHYCPPQRAEELAARLSEDGVTSSAGLRAALTRASRLLAP